MKTKNERIQDYESLVELHLERCLLYRDIVSSLFAIKQQSQSQLELKDFPYIPVSLFKELELYSIDKSSIYKIMKSSGTTGQKQSKIFLDKENASSQIKALSALTQKVIGKSRLPMIIFDSESTVRNRKSFSARTAGIIGYSMFGKDITYALDENMNLDSKKLIRFFNKYEGSPTIAYGFTYIIWMMIQMMSQELKDKVASYSNDCTLIHGGGWKKIADQEISKPAFKQVIRRSLGITRVVNYYGMVEQTGSVFYECSKGYFHTTNYSDVLIRDPVNLREMSDGKKGLIQLFSNLPTSYPGHIILTEDIGKVIGHNDCECGNMSTYFTVEGRIKNAELRGCSDTYSS